MSDKKNKFLKKLEDSLKEGKKKDDIINHFNKINKLADNIDIQEAAHRLDERIKHVGEKEKANKETYQEAEEEFVKLMSEQSKSEEKLALLAEIETKNSEIRNLKREYEEKVINIKNKYSKIISLIDEKKITLMIEFEKKYGNKAEDSFDFGQQPDKNLD